MALGMYSRALAAQPRAVKGCTSSALYFVGDLAAQSVEGRGPLAREPQGPPIDLARTARMTAWGLCFGVSAHSWYGVLDGLRRRWRWTGAGGVAKTVFFEQFTWTPVLNASMFFALKVMEGGSAADGVQSVRERLLPTLRWTLTVWPAAQAVNFALVPVAYQVLYINVLAMFWSAFLSHQAAKKLVEVEEEAGVR